MPISQFCGATNQEYKECANPCPVTCENRLNPPMCKAMCQPGCACKEGYVLDKDGNCILPEACPAPVNPKATVCRE